MSTAGDPDNNWNKEKEDPQEVRWIEAEWLQDKADQDNNDKGGNGGADDDDNGDDPDESPDFADLFADPDPLETFNFSWTIADRVPEDGNNTNINTNTNSRTVDIALTGHKAELGQTLHSTGLTLWRASELLCDYMLRHPAALQGQRVLELGAGLGLCGILAHHLQPAKVVLTDGDTDTLAFMRSNIETNCSPSSETGDDGETANTSNIQSRQLVWANRADERLQAFSQEHGPFDLILGSDIIYVEEILEPLFATVAQLLSPNEATVGQFWLAYARRNVSIDLVLETAAAFGFSFTTPADAEGVFVFQRAPF